MITVITANASLVGGIIYGIYKTGDIPAGLCAGIGIILGVAFGGKGFQKISEVKK
jgi:uncharacterized membrane protein YfcA